MGNCSFSCGSLFRTQTASQVEHSMKGYGKLEKALAGVDINLPFRWRVDKTIWMDLPCLRITKRKTNMWAFEKNTEERGRGIASKRFRGRAPF